MRAAEGADPRRATRRGRLLVIDDEELVIVALKRVLGKEHDVASVSQAEEALKLFRSGEQFDVIICDLMMPGMTGMDLHAELRQSMPEQAGRMIFLTGGSSTIAAQTFLETVSNLIIDKPFDLKKLRALVNERVG